MTELIRKQLEQFLERIGAEGAGGIRQELGQYVYAMNRYPEVVSSNIHRFLPYFSRWPVYIHGPALDCLITIAIQIPATRSAISEVIGPILYELRPSWEGRGEIAQLKALENALGMPLTEQDSLYADIVRSICELGQKIILIIGAGFSYDTMPITSELKPLLLKTLKDLKVEDCLELIEGDDMKVWGILRKNPAVFKKEFSGWCTKCKPASQHRIVAKLLNDNQIPAVISLNWDNLLERAYFELYERDINKINNIGVPAENPCLWKLHGDVDDIEGDWVFPGDPGRVFPELVEYLGSIDIAQVGYVLIVGYNEYEPVVSAELIKWFEDNVANVVRINPNPRAGLKADIKDTAMRFFNRLNAQGANQK